MGGLQIGTLAVLSTVVLGGGTEPLVEAAATGLRNYVTRVEMLNSTMIAAGMSPGFANAVCGIGASLVPVGVTVVAGLMGKAAIDLGEKFSWMKAKAFWSQVRDAGLTDEAAQAISRIGYVQKLFKEDGRYFAITRQGHVVSTSEKEFHALKDEILKNGFMLADDKPVDAMFDTAAAEKVVVYPYADREGLTDGPAPEPLHRDAQHDAAGPPMALRPG